MNSFKDLEKRRSSSRVPEPPVLTVSAWPSQFKFRVDNAELLLVVLPFNMINFKTRLGVGCQRELGWHIFGRRGSGDGSVGEDVQLQKIVITIKNLPTSECLYASINVVFLHRLFSCKASPINPIRLTPLVSTIIIKFY